MADVEPRIEGLRDPALLKRELTGWIRKQVGEAGADGVVFGLSGGIDSATVCGLAALALEPDRCLGLIMPIGSAPQDEALAREVARRFAVPTVRVRLEPAFDFMMEALDGAPDRGVAQDGGERARSGDERGQAGEAGEAGEARQGRRTSADDDAMHLARANLKPRLRMLTLYYHANLKNLLVLGTGNRDEFAVGYFTKHGDGAADAFPLADLLKSEVRGLARHLGVPDDVVEREPSAGLWAGQTDEAELGVTYEQLDRYLATGTSGDAAADETIRSRQQAARHKTMPAPTAGPGTDA
ncbi:MAG: NAD(+) synthase [Gemmatimonadota bacterium]